MGLAKGLRKDSKARDVIKLHKKGLSFEEIANAVGLKNPNNVRKYLVRWGTDDQLEMRQCPYCGEMFIPHNKQMKFCSDVHARKSKKAKEAAVRRCRTSKQIVDDDISLRKLFMRDNGICWICGETCDWNDKRMTKNGIVVAGESYPSIDHVIPLSAGGAHSWENVRLAHRHCNSVKGTHDTGRMENQYQRSVRADGDLQKVV